MSDEEFDWQASELAKTNPNVLPPEVPGSGHRSGHAVAGEVVATADAPELVEISTIRVLSQLVDAPAQVPFEAAPAGGPPAGRRGAAWVVALALLGLALAAWGLIS